MPLIETTLVSSRDNLAPDRAVYAADFDLPTGGIGTDAAPALQAAIDYAQSERLPLVLPYGLELGLESGLSIKHGQNDSTDTFRHELTLYGNSCTLHPKGAFAALSVVPRCAKADSGTGRGEAHIEIHDLSFNGAQDAASKALDWGLTNFQCSDFAWSLIENCLCEGFDEANAVRFTECLKVVVRRLACRSGAEVRIRSVGAGTFVGDMIFQACEFAGTASIRPLYLFVGNATTQAQARGIHFTDCVFYGGGTLLQGLNKAHLGDIWFTSCTWDSPTPVTNEVAIEIQGNTTTDTLVTKISIVNAYISSYTGYAIKVSGSGDFRSIRIEGGKIHNVAPTSPSPNTIILLSAVEGVSVRNVDFYGCVSASLMNFNGGCTDFSAQNCRGVAGTVTDGIVVTGASTNYIITGNAFKVSGSAINDLATGSPTRLVADNLKLV